ncbi:MAG TPA: hypothetical protein VGZ25_17105 [Gemmataceae bacterium]|jgi:hypothetical protein|nr:hypothetical protein [Gemmataceae bacterium]
MKRVRLSLLLTIVLIAIGLMPGCRDKDAGCTSVQGHVSYNGKALTRGTIVFTADCDRGGNGDMVCGEIKPDGSYFLKAKTQEGMEPGWYRVTILALEAPSTFGDGDNPGEPRSLLPDKYRDPNLSGLAVEVMPHQANIKDFDLED